MENKVNQYLRTRVMSASPEELRLMLLEGALKYARLAADGLEKKDYEKVYDGSTRSQAIILELINSLDPKYAPDICDKLTALYSFIYQRLVDGVMKKDASIFQECIRLLDYERETWVMLMEQLAREKDNGKSSGNDNNSNHPGQHTSDIGRAPLSVNG